MPELLPPLLVELRDRVSTLARDLTVLRDDASLDDPERTARVRAASKAAGVFSLTQPSDDRGPERSALGSVVVRDTLAQHGVAHLPGIFGSSPGELADVPEPLRSSHLLPLLAGEARAGFAFTEPSDAPRATWARRDGDWLVVNGQKSYVTGGADCTFLNALVDVEGSGPTMVVIDTAAPGVTLTRRFGSLDGSHHAAFRFDEVRVPAHHAIGAPGKGMARALSQISQVRLAIAAECVGTMQWTLDLVEAHAKRPRRGGTTLSDSERMRLRVGQLRSLAYAARSTVYRTARIVDSGDNAVNECAAAKAFAAESVGTIVDAAIQLVGGEALVEGHPLERAYREVRALRLAEGETDMLHTAVARGRFELGLGRI